MVIFIKQIKILKVNQTNIHCENNTYKVHKFDDTNIVKVGTYNFLVRALETYRKKEFEDDEFVTEFIKVTLPDYEKNARKQWFNGVEYNGKLYKAWFSTVGGMKQEDKSSMSKCEVIFVNEEITDFKGWFENIISLGKFSKIDKTKEMYVNKKILSRFSLATSDLITEIDMPNIIILPQAKLPWKRIYKTVEPKNLKYTDSKGNERTGVDYDLIDYEFDTDKRDNEGNPIDELNAFDGGGIATPKVMDTIGKTLNRNDIDFAIIRGFGIAIKGMVTRFDIIGYLDVMYSKTGDTDYCIKTVDGYKLKDMYGDFRLVTDNTLLLNESMVKLADFFIKEDGKEFYGMEEYEDLLNKCNCEEFKDIYDLLNKLYITKVNKRNKELKLYRRMNYQIMNVLALTNEEYNFLTEQDFRLYKKILKPYTKYTSENEFKINIDYINLFYNQGCGSEEETEELKEITSVVDKSNALININQNNVKLKYVKDNLAKLIEKKIRDMGQGRITLKATYNYIAVDPISYMNFAMTRELGANGLVESEFYCRGILDRETRTIFRNPLMAYSEVHNIKFKRSIFLDNWLCKSEEVVYFNNKSDILSLMGSADEDGDSTTMINEQIVKNAVIVPPDGKYFISKQDGIKVKCKFDDEGRFLATYTPSGNLIGQVAIMAASVNNSSQIIKTYYNSKHERFYSFIEVRNLLISKGKIDIKDKTNEEQYEIIENYIKDVLIKKGTLVYTSNIDKEVVREKIRQQFYSNEKDIYSLLYVSSLVIDSPKTMNVIDVPTYTRVIREKHPRKANFLQYAKRIEDVKKVNYSYPLNSILDNFGCRVQEELLNAVVERKRHFSEREDLLQEQLINDKYIRENAEKAWAEISDMYNSYKIELDKAQFNKYKEDKKINRKIAEHYSIKDDIVTDKLSDIQWEKDLEKIKQGFKENQKKYKLALNKIDAEFLFKANEIIASNDIYSVAIALTKLNKVSERFIINFFMSALIAVDKINPSIKYEYYKCNANEENTIPYMYEHYKKVGKKINLSDAVTEKLAVNDLVRYKLAAEVRFRNEDSTLIEDIKNSLSCKGYYDLNITNLEPFDEFKRVLEGKEMVRVKGFMLKKDGTLAIAKKSFGVCIVA